VTRLLPGLLGTLLLLGSSIGTAAANPLVLSSQLAPVAAPDPSGTPQTIAGEPGAGTVWDVRSGSTRIFHLWGDRFLLTVRAKGLIVPLLEEPFAVDPSAFPFPVPNPAQCTDFGFPEGVPCFGSNPSPLFLARVVCHDEAGEASVTATTSPAELSPEGDGKLADVISLPDVCFAPIVLVGGARPDGTPGRWFAVSGF
jgi:hypothetical protein